MEIYRRCWFAVTGLGTALGAGLAIIGLPASALLAIAIFGGLVSLMIRLSRPGATGGSPASSLAGARVYAGTTLTGAALGVAVAGWTAGTGGYGVLLVLLLTMTAPQAIGWFRSLTTPKSTNAVPDSLPSPMETLPVDEPRFAWEGSVPALPGLTDDQLVFIWRSSYAALRRCQSTVELTRIADTRRRCLDEIERRDPAGFARWVSAGARAASDPRRYLQTPSRRKHR